MDACSTLARLFALALSLPLEYFEQPGFFDNPTCMLGMNTYYFPKVRYVQGVVQNLQLTKMAVLRPFLANFPPKKGKKLALNSQLLTVQILTNDVQVLILCLILLLLYLAYF